MKLTLLSAITFVASVCMAQTKPTPKPKYNYTVTMSVSDYQVLTGQLMQSKATVIYQPGLTPQQQVDLQKQIDTYLQQLPQRVKLDSVKVEVKP